MGSDRKFDRQKAPIPLSISTGTAQDALGVTHNASSGGVRFHTRRPLQVGDQVRLTFASLEEGEEHQTVRGKVVRVDANDADNAYMWPHLIAVEFDAPSDTLQKTIDKATEMAGNLID